jgi:hypothetical protein
VQFQGTTTLVSAGDAGVTLRRYIVVQRKKSGGLRAASARDREDLGQRRGAPVIMGPGVRPPFKGLERLGVSNQLQADVVENGCGGHFALASSNSADGERQRLFEIDGRDRQSPR